MRILKQFMLLIMVTSMVSLTSCSSDDDGGGSGGSGGGTAGSGTLTAKVDGNNYQSVRIASSATIANAGSASNLIIIAANSSGKSFAITILGYEGPGTYRVGGGANISTTASYQETDVSDPQNPSTEIWQAPYDDTEVGEIIVTDETDSKVKGTFNFRCKNVAGDNSEKNITDGSFNLDKQTT